MPMAVKVNRYWYRYAARIEERCKRIGNIPYSRQPRDDLAPDHRTIAFEESALICYVSKRK